MLDNLLSDRVEKWKNKALFQRKTASLRDLNKELEAGAKELEMLLRKKKSLYDATNKDEDEDDRDAEDSADDLNAGVSDEVEKRMERIAVRLQVKEAESFIDGITRDLDLLNTDLEDLAQQLESKENNNDTPSNKNKKTSDNNWEDIGREIIDNFSLPQCRSLLWDQIGEKASLLELVKAGQFDQQEAKDEARTASSLADNMSRQLAYAKADMQSRLQKAESQRVQDVWALLRAQPSVDGVNNPSHRLSDGEVSSTARVAIQRAQDLEMELEGYIASEDKLTQQNEEQAARISSLEASLLNIQLRAQMSAASDEQFNGISSDAGSEFFDSLSSVWDSLGLSSDDRTKTISDIQRAGIRARETALKSARKVLNNSTRQTLRLQKSLTTISAALGQKEESFFNELSGIPSNMAVHDRLLSMSVLSRLSAVRDAVDAATALMTVRASGLEKLKDRLLDIMSEMWLDSNELPECLRNILGLDFNAAAAAANQRTEESSDDSDDDVDEIAAFMVTSALCVASQLGINSVTLTEGNITNWEKAMRTLNVTRAKLTTQMIALRADTATLCASLHLNSDALLYIIRGAVDVPATQAQGAAVELVLGAGVSNPPGSQILLTAVGALKESLEIIKSNRFTVGTVSAKINTSLNEILAGDEKNDKNGKKEEEHAIKVNTKSLKESFLVIGSAGVRSAAVKAALITELKSLLRHTVRPDGMDDELILSLLSPRSIISTPSSLIALDGYMKELQGISMSTMDLWVKDEVSKILDAWGGSSGVTDDDSTVRNTIAQVFISH